MFLTPRRHDRRWSILCERSQRASERVRSALLTSGVRRPSRADQGRPRPFVELPPLPAHERGLASGNGIEVAWPWQRRRHHRSRQDGAGAGASGIACGCVRNLYMTEPIHDLLRHSVDVWTADPVAFGFQQVGPRLGGGGESDRRLRAYPQQSGSRRLSFRPLRGQRGRRVPEAHWPDFKTEGIDEPCTSTSAATPDTTGCSRPGPKCADHGVRIISGVAVTDYVVEGGRVTKVVTDRRDRL